MTVRRSTIALALLLGAALPGRVSAQVGIATAYRAAGESEG